MTRFYQTFALLIALGAVVVATAGCGDSGSTEVSSATSQFSVAEDTAAEDAASSPASDASSAPEAVTSSPAASVGGAAETPPAPASPVKPPSQPPASAAPEVAAIPAGPPEKIKEYIENLISEMQRSVQGAQSEADARQRITPFVPSLIGAAEKLLADDVPDELRYFGAETKMQGFQIQTQLGIVEDDADMRTFAATLADDKSPKIAWMGKLMSYRFAIEDTAAGKSADPAALGAALDPLLASEERDDTIIMLSRQAASALNSLGLSKEAGQLLQKVGEAFQETDFADQANELLEHAQFIQTDFNGKVENLIAGKEGSLDAFKAAVEQILSGKPGRTTAQYISQSLPYLEQTDQYEAAKHLIAQATLAFADHADKELAAGLGASLERAGKRVGLIGEKFDIQGTVHKSNKEFGGQKFDWDSYRGKFVLVDFWASWCGPCREEFPNIKASYEKYREMGFEVVGVNMDQNIEEADQYLAAEPLPWQTVMCADPAAESYANPMAENAGVEGIPFVILLDREGKVMMLHVRGPKIEEKVREALGLDSEPAEAPEEEEKKS